MSPEKQKIAYELLEIAPLIEYETYNDIPTQDIIDDIYHLKNQTKNISNIHLIDDLLSDISREEAIKTSIELYVLIGKELVNEFNNLK
jgi:hypothetical protein